MSRTTAGEILENPCTKFLKWGTIKNEETEKIEGGGFKYWVKETESNEVVQLPFRFALLNPDFVCFKGYDEKNKRGVWSNEVSDPNHVVSIYTKNEKLLSFKKSDYPNQKLQVKDLGAKYTQSVYIAVDVDDTIEIWNLQLSGAALTGGNDVITPENKFDGWFGFCRANKSKLYSHWIEVNDYKLKKKGSNKFTAPVYSLGSEIDTTSSNTLNELDLELKEFHKYYFKPKKVEESEQEEEELVDTATLVEDDLPF